MSLPRFSLGFFIAVPMLRHAPRAGPPLQGRVVDAATALPIAGAAVRIEGASARAITDAEGQFALGGVRPGTWVVEVSKPPFTSTTETVVVAPNQPTPPLEL